MKNKFLLRIIQVVGAIVILFVGLWLAEVVSAWLDRGPTAIVLDAETGKPIEGAVALAQWHSTTAGGIEGPSESLSKAQEVFSDKDGKVFIKGYWGVNIFLKSPRLTIYKPGYVIWDSREICPTFEKREDFDEKHRKARLLKFDAEAPKWVEKYPKESGPRSMQKLFYNGCYDSGIIRKYSRSEIRIDDIFYNYELPLIDKEELERRAKERGSLNIKR